MTKILGGLFGPFSPGNILISIMSIMLGLLGASVYLPTVVAPDSLLVDTVLDTSDGSCSDGDCSLRDAISLAAPGDIIQFSQEISGGTIYLSSTLVISESLSIDGQDLRITISGDSGGDGSNDVRVFTVQGGSHVTFENLTITDGYGNLDCEISKSTFSCGGGIKIEDGNSVTLTHTTLQDNQSREGGAIYAWTNDLGVNLVIISSTITANQVDQRGGGIQVFNSSTYPASLDVEIDISIQGSTIISNTAGTGGGGIFAVIPSQITITHSVLNGNDTLLGDGGGIHCVECRSLVILDSMVNNNQAGSEGGGSWFYGDKVIVVRSVFSSNQSEIQGGGLNVDYADNLTLNDSLFQNNQVTHAVGAGGGLYFSSSYSKVSGSTFDGNRAGYGGGLFIYECGEARDWITCLITDSVISQNTAFEGGGGLAEASWDTVGVKNSTISGNISHGFGGGIISYAQLIDVNNSVIDNNYADSNGGGIHLELGHFSLSNSTVSSNYAGENGGGLFSDSNVSIGYSTIYSNSAVLGSNGIYAGDTQSQLTINISNTILASPQGANCTFFNTIFVSGGHNLSSDNSCPLTASGDITTTYPLVGPLTNNGGGTMTHALLPGSPAIDAGDKNACPPTDQRGQMRPGDGDGDLFPICDIGAFEVPSLFPILKYYLPLVIAH
ncbi:choice-of-anchor Q domain-containing protein [Chloroflexota bacterium]